MAEPKHGLIWKEKGDTVFMLVHDAHKNIWYYTCLMTNGKPFPGNLHPVHHLEKSIDEWTKLSIGVLPEILLKCVK